jgi:hypothetical protein
MAEEEGIKLGVPSMRKRRFVISANIAVQIVVAIITGALIGQVLSTMRFRTRQKACSAP